MRKIALRMLTNKASLEWSLSISFFLLVFASGTQHKREPQKPNPTIAQALREVDGRASHPNQETARRLELLAAKCVINDANNGATDLVPVLARKCLAVVTEMHKRNGLGN